MLKPSYTHNINAFNYNDLMCYFHLINVKKLVVVVVAIIILDKVEFKSICMVLDKLEALILFIVSYIHIQKQFNF